MPEPTSVKLPDRMQVVEISRPGGPEVLRINTRPLPRPKAGEILIRVIAAGVNRPDCFQRAGSYPPPPGASDLPGLEVAGDIVECGDGVTQCKPGDQVCALTPGGGYAEYCVAPAGHCLPVPKGWTPTQAASLPETLFTVWINVFERGRLAGDETLLVQGGASGIGVTAIQLARAKGHRVFVTAGSSEKCAACEALGAERAINYRSEDFVEVVKQLTAGKGVDVILDMVSGSYVAREIKCLADDGRLSIIAQLGGNKAEIDAGEIMRRRLTLTGSTLRPRSIAFKSGIAEALKQKVWPLIEAGKIQPVIFKVFPLAEASAAHALMESDGHIGKIVLEARAT
jgi:putative PIG3 family NAD(P)H quinone oxidoreductase